MISSITSLPIISRCFILGARNVFERRGSLHGLVIEAWVLSIIKLKKGFNWA
jgi:hypothetical protein